MAEGLVEKIKKAKNFGEGYALTELLGAAELDMQWHVLPASAAPQEPDEVEKQALTKTHLAIPAVPPRYRSSYFSHIWDSGYSAGYYAYLWTQMLDDDAYQWFDDHGGLSRANGDRFRRSNGDCPPDYRRIRPAGARSARCVHGRYFGRGREPGEGGDLPAPIARG